MEPYIDPQLYSDDLPNESLIVIRPENRSLDDMLRPFTELKALPIKWADYQDQINAVWDEFAPDTISGGIEHINPDVPDIKNAYENLIMGVIENMTPNSPEFELDNQNVLWCKFPYYLKCAPAFDEIGEIVSFENYLIPNSIETNDFQTVSECDLANFKRIIDDADIFADEDIPIANLLLPDMRWYDNNVVAEFAEKKLWKDIIREYIRKNGYLISVIKINRIDLDKIKSEHDRRIILSTLRPKEERDAQIEKTISEIKDFLSKKKESV